MLFNASAGSDISRVPANDGRLLFTGNLADIVMGLDDVETLALSMLGGPDTFGVGQVSAH